MEGKIHVAAHLGCARRWMNVRPLSVEPLLLDQEVCPLVAASGTAPHQQSAKGLWWSQGQESWGSFCPHPSPRHCDSGTTKSHLSQPPCLSSPPPSFSSPSSLPLSFTLPASSDPVSPSEVLGAWRHLWSVPHQARGVQASSLPVDSHRAYL